MRSSSKMLIMLTAVFEKLTSETFLGTGESNLFLQWMNYILMKIQLTMHVGTTGQEDHPRPGAAEGPDGRADLRPRRGRPAEHDRGAVGGARLSGTEDAEAGVSQTGSSSVSTQR